MNYTIWVNKTAVPVSREVYKAYWKGERKERYFSESNIHNHIFSYDALDTADMNGCDIFADECSCSLEDSVIRDIEKKHLANILEKLSPSEYGLIKRIYYHGDSLRKISSDTGTALSTLQYRHKKLLAKLKKLMAADGYEE